LSNLLDANFCIEALEDELIQGRPEIFNTNQGGQFTGDDFTGVLHADGIAISMDGRGSDRAPLFFWIHQNLSVTHANAVIARVFPPPTPRSRMEGPKLIVGEKASVVCTSAPALPRLILVVKL
jgi:hypothetical protein